MKPPLATQLEELQNIAEALEIAVQYERIQTIHPRRGGLCRIKGQYRLYVEKKTGLSERVAILLDTLSLFDLEGIFISPKLRELLEEKQKENTEKGRTLPT